MAVYKTTLTSTTNVAIAGTYTFSTVDIGTAATNRVVVVGHMCASGTNNTMTIGGVAATRVTKNGAASIYAAIVPTGTTGDIIVTVADASAARIALIVWVGYTRDAVTGLDSGSDSASGTTDAVASDIAIKPGGFVCAIGAQFNTPGSSFTGTWSGVDSVTENVDAELESASCYAGFLIATTVDSTTGDFTLAEGVSGTKQLAVVSYNGVGLVADAGSYVLTGTAASLERGRVVVATAGSYVLTGTAATLTLSASKTIVADSGSYLLTGTAASLREARKAVAASGSYTLTGTAASLIIANTIQASAGSYVLTGTAATLTIADIWTHVDDSQTPNWTPVS